MTRNTTRQRGRKPTRRKAEAETQASDSTGTFQELPPQDDLQGADFNDLLDVLIRQKRMIVSIVAVCVVAAAVALSMVTPRYTATGELIIETNRPTPGALETVFPGINVDNPAIISETAVLRSRSLLEYVVERLDLTSDPEFNSALRPPGLIERVLGWFGSDSEAASESDRLGPTINALQRRLDVGQLPSSRVIAVRVTSESRDKARLITNTLLDEYLLSQQRAKSLASSETNTWLADRIAELRHELLESEQRVEDFRSDQDLLQARGTTLVSQQMADLNGQLIMARTATGAATARLSQLSELLASPDSGGIYTASEVLQSPLIQNLRQQQVQVDRRIAELSSVYGPAHPTMIQLTAEADDLRNQISIEVNKIAQGLRNEVAVAQAREAALEEQVEQLTARLSQTNEAEIELRALEREAEANRELLETLLARQKELAPADELQTFQSDARIISYADRPTSPSYPAKTFSLGIVVVMSTLLALVAAFVRELRSRGLNDMDQLEASTRLTALGFIPLITSRRQKQNVLAAMVTNPSIPFAQALKAINWQLTELAPKQCKVILITSSVAGEGKTTTSIGLARTKAFDGHKTLLIDADIRSPKVHTHLEMPQNPGLRDVLENGAQAVDHIQFDRVSSLDVLPAGQASGDPLNWINSPEMKQLLQSLTRKYKFIIIDSPPLVVAPDACVLSKIADTTVLLVRWSSTPADALSHAVRMLRRNGGHVTGAVMTMLDASRQPKYNYGYYGAYGSYADQTT